jgi:lipopolysaccharide transport system ATP-binding protein
MSNLAIKVEHLSKMYRLGEINNGTLWQDIQSWAARKRNKDDPHSKLEDKYSGNKDEFWALKDISFDVKQGDRLGIIGKNGAGKSTLLKILSRITTPTEGIIKIKGKIASLLEVGTGFHSELSGRENIYINGAILGMKKRRIDQLLDSIIDFSGIEQHIDTPVKRYSSGMYVRLAFAVAAHLDSDILIADEVLAVGDAEFQKKALGKMQDLSTGEGRTVLFVSHNMWAVENLCTTGILLEKGIIVNRSNDIKRIIKEYFRDDFSLNNISQYEWVNSGDKLDNQWVKPLEFYLTDIDGELIKEPISNDKDILINIRLIFKEIDPALNIGYALYNDNNDLLYWSYQTDVSKDEWPELKTGECLLRSKMKKRFLNEGTYRVELIGGLHYKQWLFQPEVNAPFIFFEIAGGLSDSPYMSIKRPGILSPIIPWEIKYN